MKFGIDEKKEYQKFIINYLDKSNQIEYDFREKIRINKRINV